jgi:ATP-dependent Lon protease
MLNIGKDLHLHDWGTLAIVMKIFDMPDGSKSAIVQGIDRVKLSSITQTNPYFKGLVEREHTKVIESVELDALTTNLRQNYSKLIASVPQSCK